MNKTKLYYIDLLLGICIIIAFILIFANGALSNIYYEVIHYDDGYNGSVSANLMRTGHYEVSYPDHIPFYNKITTGVPVLLPVSYVYQWFGISSFTTQIVPLIYSFFTVIAIWGLLSLFLKKPNNPPYTIAAIATVLLLLADKCYYIISINLWGEIAALFFVLLSLICWQRHYLHNRLWIVLAGGFLAWSFLTKSAMIFFVVSWWGIVFLESIITKSISRKNAGLWALGFWGGFILLDGYKLYKLGGIITYINWWRAEWHNMLDQSAGFYTPRFGEKFSFLEEALNCNKYICLIMIILAIVIYLVNIIKLYKGKKLDWSYHTMSIAGITADSLLVYFLLFGKSGLLFAKRLIMNTLCLKLLFVFIVCSLAISLWNLSDKKESNTYNKTTQLSVRTLILIVSLVILFPVNKVIKNYSVYSYKPTDYSYNQKKMTEFLAEIENIPANATLYTYGWYQEPNVTLFLNREMKDITKVIDQKGVLEPNSFFIVGNMIHKANRKDIEETLNITLEKVDSIQLDYDQLHVSSAFGDFSGFDLLAIYKIIPNETDL